MQVTSRVSNQFNFRIEYKKITTCQQDLEALDPAGMYMFKVNNRNTRTRCKICLKFTIKFIQGCRYLVWLCFRRVVEIYYHQQCFSVTGF